MIRWNLLLICITILFNLTAQDRHSVLITEFLPDPSPQRNLPNAAFIELTNVSTASINLLNWQIGDNSSSTTFRTNYILEPGEKLIVCARTAETAYAIYGNTIGLTGFPSLNNDADDIILYNSDGKVIHAISYNTAWYKNNLKAEGGWSIEMINPAAPCVGEENFTASIDESGGTPGRINSVHANSEDKTLPEIVNAYFKDSLTMIVQFSETMPEDGIHINLVKIENYAGAISNFEFSNAFNNKVVFYLTQPVRRNQIYEIVISELKDCAENKNSNLTIHVALAVPFSKKSIIINEILFNPPSGGSDYVEIFNPSSSIFDLSNLYLANRSASGDIQQVKRLTETATLFFPGQYILITSDIDFVNNWYRVKLNRNAFIKTSLPSMPDDKGSIILLDQQGMIIDELQYSHKWHHPLIKDDNGVSLEKIHPDIETQLKENWTSAASSVNFGSPGFQNSHFRTIGAVHASFEIEPEIFSPDGDGYHDILLIRYKIIKPNCSGSIIIYDRSGKPVKHILSNGLLGQSGFYHWNGLNNKNQKLPAGVYIIILTIITPDGSSDKVYLPIVIAN